MASITSRRPLSQRSTQQLTLAGGRSTSWRNGSVSSSAKRPRSPEMDLTSSQAKKSKLSTTNAKAEVDKEGNGKTKKERVERDAQKLEFKEKYTKAFPSWSFYFDSENITMRNSQIDTMKRRIQQLKGSVDDFFSKEVTHLITDKPVPSTGSAKENRPNSRGPISRTASGALKSPVQFKSKGVDETARSNEVVTKAISLGLKIWNAAKLDSVLNRCLDTQSVTVAAAPRSHAAPTQKLERLLSKEKHFGPGDRDPTQRRHDYRYFSKGSFFVLVEDMREDVATIAAHEYLAPKDKGKPSWPVLHLHPHSRGPFIEFDEKEKQRWERAQQKKLEDEQAPVEKKVPRRRPRRSTMLDNPGKCLDLRRSASMNNLRRRNIESPEALNLDLDFEFEGDVFDSANASGYLVSGTPAYMAASGNSVGITSTTGTTSTTSGLRHSQMSASLDMAMKRQVVTSRKPTLLRPEKRRGTMEPPSTIPLKSNPQIKKAKSMNFKQPKREEGSKPGYCECCRQKFDDFKTHVVSSKHRRFAQNDDNFFGLDAILERVRRRTKVEVEQEEQRRTEACRRKCRGIVSSSPTDLVFPNTNDSTP